MGRSGLGMNGYKTSEDFGVDGLWPRAVGMQSMRLREFFSWRGISHPFVGYRDGLQELKGEESLNI